MSICICGNDGICEQLRFVNNNAMIKKSVYLAVTLIMVAAACSVALACCGADRALDFMRYYAAIGAVGAFITGTNLGANQLFATMHMEAANILGINKIMTFAASNGDSP